MIKRLIGAAIAVLLVGCGSDGGSDSDSSSDSPIQGDWYYANTQTNCALILNVKGADYEAKQLCATSASTANIQIEDGALAIGDTELTFTPKRSSCADLSPAKRPYKVTADQLNITLGTTIVIARRLKTTDQQDNGFALTTGCFDDKGSFTARAVAP